MTKYCVASKGGTVTLGYIIIIVVVIILLLLLLLLLLGKRSEPHTNDHGNLIPVCVRILYMSRKMCGSLLRTSAMYCVGVAERALWYRVAKLLT